VNARHISDSGKKIDFLDFVEMNELIQQTITLALSMVLGAATSTAFVCTGDSKQ